VDGRLARRARPPQDERLSRPQSSPRPPEQDARGGPQKKTPGLGAPLTDLIRPWAEAYSHKANERRAAAELAANFGHLRAQQLRAFHIATLIEHWKTHYKRSTVFSYRGALKRLLRYLDATARTALSHQVPRVQHGSRRTTTATPEELHRLLQLAPAWLKLLILLCTQLGLRSGAAAKAAPHNWRAQENVLVLTSKGGKTRAYPVTPQIQPLLQLAAEKNPTVPFIEALRGRPFNPAARHRPWHTLKRQAAVNPNLTFHDLRRTAATALYEKTRDILAVKEFLGHEWLNSILHYIAPFDTGKMRELVQQLPLPTEVKQ